MPEGGNNCKQDYGTHGTLKTLSHCKHEIYLQKKRDIWDPKDKISGWFAEKDVRTP